MGYNPFRWWTKGRKTKPLKANAPLLLKIRNGDFDYSYMFNEAKVVDAQAVQSYELAYKNYVGDNESNRVEAAHEVGRMKRLKARKLEMEAHQDETRILTRLRKELESEFGSDLWDTALSKKIGKGTIEELYWWYKKQVNEVTTYSEIDIQLRRNNTKGLEYLFA